MHAAPAARTSERQRRTAAVRNRVRPSARRRRAAFWTKRRP